MLTVCMPPTNTCYPASAAQIAFDDRWISVDGGARIYFSSLLYDLASNTVYLSGTETIFRNSFE